MKGPVFRARNNQPIGLLNMDLSASYMRAAIFPFIDAHLYKASHASLIPPLRELILSFIPAQYVVGQKHGYVVPEGHSFKGRTFQPAIDDIPNNN
jgi:hypothetical protein